VRGTKRDCGDVGMETAVERMRSMGEVESLMPRGNIRRVEVAVPMPEAKRRVLAFFKTHPGLRRASEFAIAIWPEAEFKAQGAGAAASRILVALKKDGLVRWTSRDGNWGWELR